MRHLIISEYGSWLGIKKGLLLVKQGEEESTYPINRLSTVSIAKRGVAFSSDLVETLSNRGVKLFFLGFKGTANAVLVGNTGHGVVRSRMNQYSFCQGNTLPLARQIIQAKIKNQRAVLNYFAKYHKELSLLDASDMLKLSSERTLQAPTIESLLGLEGESAHVYFSALRNAKLFSSTFKSREGRGSCEINNSMLNFGYAVLSSYVLSAIENAGLEPYLGILHSIRPGKMSLVLDIMEEYRAWVVDRSVIKLRAQSEGKQFMTPELKKALIREIQATCSKKYPYRKKMVKLEHIIQRQVYRMSGHFCSEKKYRPYLFKW